eukprot:g1126.t1
MVKSARADSPSENAVKTACGGAAGKHRFHVKIPPGNNIKKGEKVFVYAINPVKGNHNPLLSNGAGQLQIPEDILEKGSIRVRAGQTLTLQAGSTDAPQVEVSGILKCPTTGSVTLRTKRILIKSGGHFQCGSASSPVTGKVVIILRDIDSDKSSKQILVEPKGTLTLFGNPSQSLRSRLREEAKKGANILRLRDSVAGKWAVGDKIVVSTTSFNRQPSIGQNEEVTISSISLDGRDVVVAPPLKFAHYGGKPSIYANGRFSLDETAHIFNLRRSIHIQTEGKNGGRVMLLRGSSGQVSAVEMSNMGEAGRMGWYPFHWHRAGDVIRKQFIRYSSIHKSNQRCIVVHGTNRALVEDNTCFDFHGHGIFLEDGDEVNNEIRRNLVVLAKKAIKGKELLQSEHIDTSVDRFPSPAGIWVSNPSNSIVGNVAISSFGTGIWMAFVKHLCCLPTTGCTQEIQSEKQCREKYGSTATFMQVNKLPTGKFDNNVGASCVVGMNWDGAPILERQQNPRNPPAELGDGDRGIEIVHYSPPSVPTFRNNVMYKNSRRAMYFRGEQAIFEGSIFADNGGAPLFAFNQVLLNSLTIGWSSNAELEYFHDKVGGSERMDVKARKDAYGLNLYDGPLVLDNLYAAGFPNLPIVRDSAQPTTNYAPTFLRSVGASERFVNLGLKVFFEDDPKPKQLYHLKSRSQAATLYDVTGDVTGKKGWTLTGDDSINVEPRCQEQGAGSFAILCENYKVGTVTWMAQNVYGTVSRLSPSGGKVSSRDPTFQMNGVRHIQVITSRGQNDYRYHITDIGVEKEGQMRFIFRHDNKGGMSPPLLFHYGKSCPDTASWHIEGNVKTYDSEDSMSGHSDSRTSGVFYDHEKKIAGIRLPAVNDRTALGLYKQSGARAQSHMFSLRCVGAKFTPTENTLAKGSLDRVALQPGGKVNLAGWACVIGGQTAAKVILKDGRGSILVAPTTTNADSESAIHELCQTSHGIKHRFNFHVALPEALKNGNFRVDLFVESQKGSPFYVSSKHPNAQISTPVKFSDYLSQLRGMKSSGHIVSEKQHVRIDDSIISEGKVIRTTSGSSGQLHVSDNQQSAAEGSIEGSGPGLELVFITIAGFLGLLVLITVAYIVHRRRQKASESIVEKNPIDILESNGSDVDAAWTQHIDESRGLPYFYNVVTGESRWAHDGSVAEQQFSNMF